MGGFLPKTRSATSADDIRKIVTRFDVQDTPYLKGLTVSDAREVLAFCEEGTGKVSPHQAAEMVDRLIDFYGHQSFKSEKAARAVSAALTALVTEVSFNAARRAFHPVTGLPRKAEFLSVAKVAKALEDEEARMFRIMANARWVISQREAAEKQAAEDAAIEAGKGTADERAARVAALMASLKEKAAHAA